MDSGFEGSRIVGFEVEPFSVKHKYTPPFTDAAGTFDPSMEVSSHHPNQPWVLYEVPTIPPPC